MGKPNFKTTAIITAKIGSNIKSVADILRFILAANTADTISRAGTLTRIRSDIITTFWRVVTSFVILVVNDAVENSSIFLNENLLIFLNISDLSRYANFWLAIAEVFIVARPPQSPMTASSSINIPY